MRPEPFGRSFRGAPVAAGGGGGAGRLATVGEGAGWRRPSAPGGVVAGVGPPGTGCKSNPVGGGWGTPGSTSSSAPSQRRVGVGVGVGWPVSISRGGRGRIGCDGICRGRAATVCGGSSERCGTGRVTAVGGVSAVIASGAAGTAEWATGRGGTLVAAITCAAGKAPASSVSRSAGSARAVVPSPSAVGRSGVASLWRCAPGTSARASASVSDGVGGGSEAPGRAAPCCATGRGVSGAPGPDGSGPRCGADQAENREETRPAHGRRRRAALCPVP